MSNNKNNNAPAFKVESFGAVDGPGIRLVIFLQGCTLRCLYCHNPESWELKKCGVNMISPNEVINLYKNNKSYYENGGGITISGGEPTLHFDFLIELAKKCHKDNIHLTIDTSASTFNDINIGKFKTLAKYVNLWLVDIKHMDKSMCKEITMSDKFDALKFIEFLENEKCDYWVRHVLLPNFTDDEEHLTKLGQFISNLKHMRKFEILPYHEMAIDKYKKLGINYRLKGKTRPATSDDVINAMKYIKKGMKINNEI